MDTLKKLRNDLDMCDEIIIDALRMRYQIIQEITNYKQENNIEIVQPEEEARKKKKVEEKLDDFKYKKSVCKVYENILYRSKRIQSHEIFDHNIFLIGFMGAGKSTISKALQHTFGMDVIEMDEIIAERNEMSIPEIFETYGEEYFRKEETNLLLECQHRKNVIISCGGGVAMRQENVDAMRRSGKIVLLTATPETILERVKSSHDRPLLENNKTIEHITDLMNKRKAAYEAAGDITISTDNKNAFQICEEIITKAKESKEK